MLGGGGAKHAGVGLLPHAQRDPGVDYGVDVEIFFVSRIRGMVRFDDAEALVATMKDDVRRAREVLDGAEPPA